MIANMQPCFSAQPRSQPSPSGPHHHMMKQTHCFNHLHTFDVQHTSKRCKDDRYVSDMLAELPYGGTKVFRHFRKCQKPNSLKESIHEAWDEMCEWRWSIHGVPFWLWRSSPKYRFEWDGVN